MLKKKNTGGFFLFINSILYMLLSVFYLATPLNDFLSHIITTGTVLMVCGLVCITAFINNPRAYFRPGWILSQGFLQILLGFYILFNRLVTNHDSYFIIFGAWALFTGITQISVSIQIRALDISRWYFVLSIGLFNLLIGMLMMLNMFKFIDLLFVYTAIYFISLSVSYVLEFFVYRKGSA